MFPLVTKKHRLVMPGITEEAKQKIQLSQFSCLFLYISVLYVMREKL